MCLSEQERSKRLTWNNHLIQAFHERKYLFPHCEMLKDMFKECVEALKDSSKSIVLTDEREGVSSTHIVMFVNQAAKVVALPIAVNPEDIHLFTLKDVHADWNNPNWFIDNYNTIAATRGMQQLPRVIRPSTRGLMQNENN